MDIFHALWGAYYGAEHRLQSAMLGREIYDWNNIRWRQWYSDMEGTHRVGGAGERGRRHRAVVHDFKSPYWRVRRLKDVFSRTVQYLLGCARAAELDGGDCFEPGSVASSKRLDRDSGRAVLDNIVCARATPLLRPGCAGVTEEL